MNVFKNLWRLAVTLTSTLIDLKYKKMATITFVGTLKSSLWECLESIEDSRISSLMIGIMLLMYYRFIHVNHSQTAHLMLVPCNQLIRLPTRLILHLQLIFFFLKNQSFLRRALLQVRNEGNVKIIHFYFRQATLWIWFKSDKWSQVKKQPPAPSLGDFFTTKLCSVNSMANS